MLSTYGSWVVENVHGVTGFCTRVITRYAPNFSESKALGEHHNLLEHITYAS